MMRRLYILLSAIVLVVPLERALAQRPDRAAFVRHVRTDADSLVARTNRLKAKHGDGAFKLFAPPGALIGLTAIRNNRPVFRQDLGIQADMAVHADSVWPGGATGFDLTGDSIYVGIWDSGYPRVTHEDFDDGFGGSRIDTLGVNRSTRFVYDSSGVTPHAHNMAGIAASGGVDPARRGVAYESLVLAYDDTLDLTEMDEASGLFDLRLSSHSYGAATGWGPFIAPDTVTVLPSWWGDTTVSYVEDYYRGFYDEESVAWDLFVRTHPFFLPILAVGNDRDTTQALPSDSLHWFFSGCSPGPDCYSGWSMSKEYRYDDDEPDGYDSILGGMQSSKNTLAVGAVYNLTGHCGAFVGPELAMSFYSSWGPTDDGRIKPDVVAPGSRLRVPRYWEDTGGNCLGSGTSHSAPLVAGGVGLMLEQSKNNGGIASTAASLKALVIHTATDLGSTGPDYQFGWGLADLARAARLMEDDYAAGTDFNIHEDTLSSTDTVSYVVLSDGGEPLKATAVWTDPPGLPVSDASRAIPKAEWLDNDIRMLVNDLDLAVKDSAATYLPWTLDPLNPSAGAVRTTRNELDNVEQVLVDTPDASVFVVEMTHTGGLDGGSQEYSLLVSGQVPTAGVSLKVFLEGPMLGGSMVVPVLFSTAVPSATPYGDAFYAGTSVEHDGSEWLYRTPAGFVDWVVVSTRSDTTGTSEVGRRSALVTNDGSIVDIDGGPVRLPTGGFDSLFVVVNHRNHAAVMSAQRLDVSSGSASWDFTTAMSQAYTSGGSPMKSLGGGLFAMFACDANADGQMTAPDFNLWSASTSAGQTGYFPADCNMDGQATAPDFNLYSANTSAGAKSRVPL